MSYGDDEVKMRVRNKSYESETLAKETEAKTNQQMS